MTVVVAAATPWGHGALAVVRLSGDGLDAVLRGFVRPLRAGPWRPGRTRRVVFFDDGGAFDDGVAVVARAPRSYTGEDTAELSCHGNPVIVERLVRAAAASGARVAEPGELTRRALERGKLDLVRAEAVLQVARAATNEGLAVARAGLDGTLGGHVDALRARLVGCAAELEARLDYPDDELALTGDAALVAELVAVRDALRALAGTFEVGRVLVEGARVALVGAVNAGKSSLFNALLGRARALVHETAGTTRDVLEVATRLDGVAVTLLDTAGERETDDPVEAAGLALARELTEHVDLLVVVLRARPEGPSAVERAILDRTAGRPRVLVTNGVDRPGCAPPAAGSIPTVATAGTGLDRLRRAIRARLVGEAPGGAQLVVASARQRDRLEASAVACDEAVEGLEVAGVAVAADAVTRAVEELDALTGADTREDVLDALFARFCIGK